MIEITEGQIVNILSDIFNCEESEILTFYF